MSENVNKPDMEGRLGNLTAAQRALLEQRLMQRRSAVARRNAISRREVESPCELSYAQELLWLLSQVFDDGIAYNAPAAFQLEGPLDLELLRRAFEGLVERHEILRTTYTVIDGIADAGDLADCVGDAERGRPSRLSGRSARRRGAAGAEGRVQVRIRPRQRAGAAPDGDSTDRQRAHPDARTCITSRPTATHAGCCTAT